MGEERFAQGERNGPVDHFERRTPRAWASGRIAARSEAASERSGGHFAGRTRLETRAYCGVSELTRSHRTETPRPVGSLRSSMAADRYGGSPAEGRWRRYAGRNRRTAPAAATEARRPARPADSRWRR